MEEFEIIQRCEEKFYRIILGLRSFLYDDVNDSVLEKVCKSLHEVHSQVFPYLQEIKEAEEIDEYIDEITVWSEYYQEELRDMQREMGYGRSSRSIGLN